MVAFRKLVPAALLSTLQLVSAAPVLNERTPTVETVLNVTEVAPLAKRAGWPKRGLPFNDGNWIWNFNGEGSQINWAYSWSSRMPDNFPSHYLEFNPMLWGAGEDKTGPWFENVENALSRGCGHLLAFNEPERGDQANMSPQQAADLYRSHLMPFAHRASLGAPAVSSEEGVGLPWLQDFLGRCGDCKVDFVPIHWYGDHSHLDHFFQHVEKVHRVTGGKEIWITEFSAFGNTQQQIEFLHKVLPWLDNQPYVYRYSWFWADPRAAGEGGLVKSDGWPTDVGNVFAYTPYGHL